jgi:DUF1680 family protein
MWMWSLLERGVELSRRCIPGSVLGAIGILYLIVGLGGEAAASGEKVLPHSFWPGVVQPFDMRDVRLLPSPFLTAREADAHYLLSLDPDRLLYNFRVNAGLPHPGRPLGGWEAPDCEVRGHFVGHYLSACSLLYRATGDEAFRQRVDYLVAELAKCQKALGGEYLSAFPTSFFDRLEAGKPVWAPYYTIHKIMAGLVDAYTLCGNKQALRIAERMAAYFKQRTDRLAPWQMDRVLQVEFGGMPAVLYRLYTLTHNPNDLVLAHRFDQASFLGPLALHHDDLTGIHANTHIPKILGAARRYELFRDPTYRSIVSYFWNLVTQTRSYATGGSNAGEFWGPPDRLANTLVANNQETCTTYNMLKVTRTLFTWTADEKYADFYERALYNGILEAQDPQTGMMIYYTPLAAGNTKQWGTPTHSFWCCYGTGVESFAKLNDSIYFHSSDGLYVNLFIPSELDWQQKGLRLIQETDFPESDTTKLLFRVRRPTRLTLTLRVPAWTTADYRVWVDGKPLMFAVKPGSYLPIERLWRDGDTVEVKMPMTLHTVSMPDDKNMVAFMVGPIVLAGIITPEVRETYLLDEHGLPLTAGYIPINNLAAPAMLQPVAGQPLVYKSIGTDPAITFIPLYRVIHQAYGVYWRLIDKASPQYARFKAALAERAQREALVVDRVQPGDINSEQAHHVQAHDSNTGVFNGGQWRDATGSFSWQLKVLPHQPMVLTCMYWGDEGGERVFDILVDGQKLATQTLLHNHPGAFFEVDYPIPFDLTRGKQGITVTFQAHPNAIAGGVFRCEIRRQVSPSQSVLRER